MNCRLILSLLLIMAVVVLLPSCGAESSLESIQVIPGAQATIQTGQQVQFKAIGTYHHSNQSTSTSDLTAQVKWVSSNDSAVTINSTGLATGVAAGSATITADMHASSGNVTGTSSVAVTGVAHDLTAITIIPPAGSQTVYSTGETAQFIAIGTFNSAPSTLDLTDQVTWVSSDVKLATINPSGLATAVDCALGGGCVTNITALMTSPSGATITGTSNLSVDATGTVNLPTLTVYRVGLGTGTVASTPTGLSCGTGAACTGNFVLNSIVTLTATPAAGSTFGGWSANCTPATPPPTPPFSCQLVMGNNDTVGAIFNN